MTIHKYPFDIEGDSGILSLPAGAKPIHIGLDPQGTPCLWAVVDPRAPLCERAFRVVGTGWQDCPPAERHIGTFVVGPFVWHAFLGGEDAP